MTTKIPSFYDLDQVGTLFYPDTAAVSQAAAAAELPPAAADGRSVTLLLIDMQIDFCHPQGALFVPGAPDDIRRVNEFIFRHAAQITNIVCTLDSHLPFQIFHPPWWVDDNGRHPAPLTLISADDVAAGKWRPVVMPEFSREYVRLLEEQARKTLTIWPYHVLIGGLGNALDPALHSVVMWHSLARKTQPTWLVKGRVPQSEHYSAIQPEIAIPDHPQGGKHDGFLQTIRAADVVFVAGEAESHCVLETLHDLVRNLRDEPGQLQKIYVLQDCMSAVQHPDIDFHALAQRHFADFTEAGVNFIDSTQASEVLAGGETAVPSQPAPVTHLHTMADWERP